MPDDFTSLLPLPAVEQAYLLSLKRAPVSDARVASVLRDWRPPRPPVDAFIGWALAQAKSYEVWISQPPQAPAPPELEVGAALAAAVLPSNADITALIGAATHTTAGEIRHATAMIECALGSILSAKKAPVAAEDDLESLLRETQRMAFRSGFNL